MHEPQLIARAAGGDVVALLGRVVLRHAQSVAGRRVDHRQQNHVALVALELRWIARREMTPLQLHRADVLHREIFDEIRLILAEERDGTQRPPVVFGHVRHRVHQPDDPTRLRLVPLLFSTMAELMIRHHLGDVRLPHSARIAKRTNRAVVRQTI